MKFAAKGENPSLSFIGLVVFFKSLNLLPRPIFDFPTLRKSLVICCKSPTYLTNGVVDFSKVWASPCALERSLRLRSFVAFAASTTFITLVFLSKSWLMSKRSISSRICKHLLWIVASDSRLPDSWCSGFYESVGLTLVLYRGRFSSCSYSLFLGTNLVWILPHAVY